MERLTRLVKTNVFAAIFLVFLVILTFGTSRAAEVYQMFSWEHVLMIGEHPAYCPAGSHVIILENDVFEDFENKFNNGEKGISPAFSQGKNIFIKRETLSKYTPETIIFIFDHECGHIWNEEQGFDKFDEFKADAFSVLVGKEMRQIYKSTKDFEEVCKVLHNDIEGDKRCKAILSCFEDSNTCGKNP